MAFYVFWEIMLVPMYLIIGIWGGRDRIYGRLDRGSTLRAIAKGPFYATHRVFFADEATARACGFRPCGSCMRAEYRTCKAEQVGFDTTAPAVMADFARG